MAGRKWRSVRARLRSRSSNALRNSSQASCGVRSRSPLSPASLRITSRAVLIAAASSLFPVTVLLAAFLLGTSFPLVGGGLGGRPEAAQAGHRVGDGGRLDIEVGGEHGIRG